VTQRLVGSLCRAVTWKIALPVRMVGPGVFRLHGGGPGKTKLAFWTVTVQPNVPFPLATG
jgi:hypothetical protein